MGDASIFENPISLPSIFAIEQYKVLPSLMKIQFHSNHSRK
jgi:hypothetical protein